MRTADHEPSCRVDKELCAAVYKVCGQDGIEYILPDIPVDLLLADFLIMLGGQHDRFQSDRDAVGAVFHGDLGLSVGTKIRQGPVLADLGQSSGKLMGQGHAVGHILFCFICGITEHHALVAGANGRDGFLRLAAVSGFQRLVNAHGDVRRLLVNSDHDRAGIRVESHGRIRIADLPDGIADDLRIVDLGCGGDLAGDNGKTGADHSLTGDTAHGILGQTGVQDRVRDRVADLIGMAFRNRF